MDISTLLDELTVDEKIALVSGTDFMYTNPIPRLGIPAVCTSDGPHGLRKQTGEQDNGIAQSVPATAFPTAVCTASSWNPENTYKMGQAIAKECRHYGVNVLLGPGVNIKRNPLCGRNFEYFSEDPLLAGEMGAGEVTGVQSEGIGVSVKHFAMNNSENYRFMGNSVVDMRTAREIYLKVFEIIVKKSKPHTLMCAYNRINGVFCSENRWLLTDVLRNEWGFDGAVMTDWGATHKRVDGVKAGLDLEMPGDTAICRKWLKDAIENGELSKEELDKAVLNILRLAERYENQKAMEVDFKAHNELSAKIAEDSAVLLENDGILPLADNEKLFVVGDLFEKMRYQGAGSSMINPTSATSPKNAFDNRGIRYEFSRGYAENRIATDEKLICEAVKKASAYEKVLVFAGLTDYVESEGGDRENMRLPENQLALIDAMINTGKKVIVVLYGGSPVELPFADKVCAILNMYLPGQNGGTATANILFGDVNPSGRLAETWARSYEDVPFGAEFSKNIDEIYKESIFVGYRYYLTAGKQVRYPFGYGLSYTTFSYSDMQVSKKDGKIVASCEVKNVGEKDGAEVVQLYVSAPKTDVFKPERELRAFAKLYIKAGESKRAVLAFDEKDLAYWNVKENRYVTESGKYELQICSDCTNVILADSIEIVGENVESPYSKNVVNAYRNANMSLITDEVFEEMSGVKIPSKTPTLPITLESRFTDLRQTFMGKILFGAVLSVANGQMKKAQKLPEGTEKDNKIKGAQFLKRILESNSIRSMSMSAGKSFPYNVAQGFVNMSNGKFFKGVGCCIKGIKAPKLPKDSK